MYGLSHNKQLQVTLILNNLSFVFKKSHMFFLEISVRLSKLSVSGGVLGGCCDWCGVLWPTSKSTINMFYHTLLLDQERYLGKSHNIIYSLICVFGSFKCFLSVFLCQFELMTGDLKSCLLKLLLTLQ